MMNVTHNLVVLHESTRLIEALIKDGDLQCVRGESRQGISGPLYRPSATLLASGRLYALSDLEFRFGACNLRCHTYTLPPEEYRGLVTASPAYQQFEVQALHAELCAGQSGLSHQDWSAQLAEVVRRGPRLTPEPYLVASSVPAARWLPEETRLAHNHNGWMLCLEFELPELVRLEGITRSAAGIDLGLGKLAVAVYKSGLIHHAPGITLIQLQHDELAQHLHAPAQLQTAQQLNSVLQYAAARTHLHDFLTVLLSAASSVGFEALDFPQMSPHFRRRSRDLGLRDFSYVWLPKRLQQVGIGFNKLPAQFTSQYCNTTHLIGVRDTHRSHFTDGNNHRIDADENAARNILDLSLAARIWGRPNTHLDL